MYFFFSTAAKACDAEGRKALSKACCGGEVGGEAAPKADDGEGEEATGNNEACRGRQDFRLVEARGDSKAESVT